jgi:hypothetical protein
MAEDAGAARGESREKTLGPDRGAERPAPFDIEGGECAA